jgi:O-antigen/teichoic acid export membrane protein
LWFVACAVALPIANFYGAPNLLTIIPIASFAFVLSGLQSVGRPLAQKRMLTKRLATFEIAGGALWASGQVALAYVMPTIWSLVIGLLFGAIISTIGSFLLIPGLRLRFQLLKDYIGEIVRFGKWVFLGSAVYYGAISFDRFYLATVITFDLLGVYGISRAISELISLLAGRLGNMVVFPFIASKSHAARSELRALISPLRIKFLILAAVGFAFATATVDLAIKIVFDARYHAAAWMVPVLIVGAWISILCSLNESTLLGVGKPRYNAISYALKFGFLLIALPLGFAHFGMPGCIVVVAASDVPRYVASMGGQMHEHLSFARQDFLVTLLMLALTVVLVYARWASGFGTPFDGFLAA